MSRIVKNKINEEMKKTKTTRKNENKNDDNNNQKESETINNEEDQQQRQSIDSKVRHCLNFLRATSKNKLLNAFIRKDIEQYEQLKGKSFNEPVDFYQINDEFKSKYNLYLSGKGLKFTKNEKNTTISCPNCKSLDVIVQYKQFLSGDEVETEIIQCNYCGGMYTNL